MAAAGAASAAMAGLFTTSLVKGVGRLTAIENAEAQLRGLGHEAEVVEEALSNAMDSVLGTAFGFDQAAGLAGRFMAAGIKPGQELERTLRLVGDAAAQAQVDLSE